MRRNERPTTSDRAPITEIDRRALLGGVRHTRRSLYGHWFRDEVCLCGLTFLEQVKRFKQ